MIFTYDNTPIYYTLEGKGPTLFFIHGFLESSTMWKYILPYFRKTHQLLTMDLPGHGQSACLGETHTMEQFADVAIQLLDYLKIDQATFIGHSMGGYVTLAAAEKTPTYLQKVVLLNSSPTEDSSERKLNRERALQLIPKAKEAFISMAIANLFTPEHQEEFAEEIQQQKKETQSYPVQGITAAIRGMKKRKDRTQQLKDYHGPKFMICGVKDPIININSCKTLAKSSGCKVFEVPGGHMSHIECSAEIVKILQFIENICT